MSELLEVFNSKGAVRTDFTTAEIASLDRDPDRKATFNRLRGAIAVCEADKLALSDATAILAKRVRAHQTLCTRQPSTIAQMESIRRREWLAVRNQRN
jgi:hypothetical protein